MRPFEAALKGSREIGFTIVSITFSLIAVFIPVLLMGGMVGRVFREFAVSIAVAIVVSGFVSLTLTPMLCARVLRSHHPEDEKKQFFLLRMFERLFEGMLNTYQWTLDRVLAFKFNHADGHARHFFATIWLYMIVPKGFFPQEDTGYLSRHHRGRDRHLISARSTASAQGRRHRPQGPGGRLRELDDWRRRPELGRQQRTHAGGAQAAQGTQQSADNSRPSAQDGHCRAGASDLFPADSRTSISAAGSPKASISTRCSPMTPTRCTSSRQSCGTRSRGFPDCWT